MFFDFGYAAMSHQVHVLIARAWQEEAGECAETVPRQDGWGVWGVAKREVYGWQIR